MNNNEVYILFKKLYIQAVPPNVGYMQKKTMHVKKKKIRIKGWEKSRPISFQGRQPALPLGNPRPAVLCKSCGAVPAHLHKSAKTKRKDKYWLFIGQNTTLAKKKILCFPYFLCLLSFNLQISLKTFFLSSAPCPPLRMYETSCTCEILHWTPHVHRLKLWIGSLFPAASWTFFYHLGHNGFELYTCACWTLLTHTVLRSNQKKLCTGVNISFNIRPKNSTFLKEFHLFILVRYKVQMEQQHEVERVKKKKRVVLVLLTYLTLVCCSMKLTAVVLFIHMNTFMKYVIEVNYTFTL